MNKEKRGRKKRESRAGGEKGEEPTLMGKGGREVRTGARQKEKNKKKKNGREVEKEEEKAVELGRLPRNL